MTRVMVALTIVGLMAITALVLGLGIALAARGSVHRRPAARAGGHGPDTHVWASADGATDCDASSASGGDCGGGDGGGGSD